MHLDTASNTSQLLGASNALFYVGGIVGSLSVSFFADRYGRKASIGIGMVLILVTTALLAASQHIAMFIVFRFINGIGYISPPPPSPGPGPEDPCLRRAY